MIVLNEDVYTEEKEYPMPNYDTLKGKEAWVHLHPNIMSTGRCGHYIPPGLTEEQRDELVGKMNEKEEAKGEVIPRLRSIAEDTKQYPHGGASAEDD